MIRFPLIALAVLLSALVAGGLSYYFAAPPPPGDAPRLAVMAPPKATVPGAETLKATRQKQTADDFLRVAREIIKQLPDTQASARTEELPIVGHIPLPRPRPIPWAAQTRFWGHDRMASIAWAIKIPTLKIIKKAVIASNMA
jgi:hypothetical protein